MALTLESANLVKQRALIESRKVGASVMLRAFFEHLINLGNPDLQFVALDYTGNADQVIADVACKLYVLFLVKPTASTVDAWVKVSDHATVAAANGDVVAKMIGTGGGGQTHAIVFADGLELGTGATTASHTAVDGNTDSQDADACAGFAIVGAA